jgi:hypothetical protein
MRNSILITRGRVSSFTTSSSHHKNLITGGYNSYNIIDSFGNLEELLNENVLVNKLKDILAKLDDNTTYTFLFGVR